jgi:uncharacterized membrane protein YgaE (UPF0421/DUF939 family)
MWARAWHRLRTGWSPIVLCAFGAAAAWFIAHRLLGHRQPFFAPISAAIALSTSRIQRSARIAQMVAGVLLGIGVGELLVALIGSSTVSISVIVLATMSAALISGIGVFGEGMMFANQAAASAILVATVHRIGTGSERAIDVLVGGAVALVLGVGLFPAEPRQLLREAEQSVLAAVAETLDDLAVAAAEHTVDDEWLLHESTRLNQQVTALARARATARLNVRIAPRRRRLRQAVERETERLARIELLVHSTLGLARSFASADPTPETLESTRTLAGAVRSVAATGARQPADALPGGTAIAFALGQVASDLEALTES